MTPGQIAALQNPLIAIADPISSVGANADEGEYDVPGGIKWYPLVNTASPMHNELVCQDGIESYLLGRGVPCNLKIGNPITTQVYMANGTLASAQAVVASSDNGQPVAAIGDSGAVVFTIHTATTRTAVGMISSGPAGCDPNCTDIYVVDQAKIMSAFAVHLNPHT